MIKAEEALVLVIDELDNGMRIQFKEKFEEIKIEFDKVFKELFGGGRGTIELVEGEDILEAGIVIISQPPGKKLQMVKRHLLQSHFFLQSRTLNLHHSVCLMKLRPHLMILM